jgi:hypothetical protein
MYVNDPRPDDCAYETMDTNDAPNPAETMDTTNTADDRTNDTADGDDVSDITDSTDADAFEIITETQTNMFPDLDLTVPDPEQILLAELESPPENPPNLLEPGSSDPHPEVIVEHFPYRNPGAPISGMPGCSTHESSQGGFGESVWAPFQSECDWRFAHWAKVNKPSSSALTNLLAIPNVCPSFFFLYCVAKCGLSLWRGSAFHIVLQMSSIQFLICCLATHPSSARTLTSETKAWNFIFATSWIASTRSMEIPSSRRTWFLLQSDIMWTVSKRSKCMVTCIQVIGGGPHRCAI